MIYQNSTTSLSKIDQASNKVNLLLPAHSGTSPLKQPEDRSKGLGLRTKVILIAIALGVIPVTTIGAISYKVTQSHLTKQINQTQQDRSSHMAQMLEKYIISRANEGETLAANPIFTNPNVMATVTESQKKAVLDSFQSQTTFYDSIVYLDLQGNPLFQSQSDLPLRKNYSQQEYFQTAIASKNTTLNELGISPFTGEPRIEFAVPVKHAWTDEVVGVLRFRIPSDRILPLFENYVNSDEQWYVINTQGMFFASALENLSNQPLANYFPQLQQAHATVKIATELVSSPINSEREQIINYTPIKIGAINSNLNVGTAVALDTDIAFAPLKSLKWIYLGGTIGTVLLVGSIAGFLANRIVQPLLDIIAGVKQLSQGKLNTKIKLNRQDELAMLGDGINIMAEQLGGLIERQKTLAKTAELMARISQSRTSRELQLPLSLFLEEVRNFIKSDRVVFYQFDPQWRGTVVAESVAQDFPRTLGAQFDDPCFAKEYVRKYQKGRIQAIPDIYMANLNPCHLQQLEPYEVKASLVLPIIIESSTSPTTPESEKLIGLLIAHQCSSTRIWFQPDVDYMQQTAYQLAMVLRGYVLQKEENLQKSAIKEELAQILSQMKSVSQGDLSHSLENKTNSFSDITKSFNTVFHNLRQTIEEIKTPSHKVYQELSENKSDLIHLKSKLKEQANQLTLIFAFMEQIKDAVIEVSSQVGTASHAVDSVVVGLESERINFSQAIAFMSQLENSLRDNRDKVKSLSAASQKMTRVIASIRKINLRASLLANKLSSRIPKIDESAFGLKEEIKSIQQSIAVTKELENVVLGIDREINQVLQEYQKSESRLGQENYLVTSASKNLEQIVKMTRNAQQNLFSLVNMTKMQQQTTQKLDNLQQEFSKTSASITLLSDRTLTSLEETSITAKDLKNVVDFFKLEPKTM